MPTYTYRREDGTTFDIRQSFSDDPLEIDPETGQKVHRVPQASGIIFKGSGFYINDNKSASKSAISSPKGEAGDGASAESSSESSSDASSSTSDSTSSSSSDTSSSTSSSSTSSSDSSSS